MFQKSRWAALALALAFLPATSRAAVIVANTGATNDAGGFDSTLLLGAGFLSPNVATTITGVLLPMDGNNANPDPGSVGLSLYNNNGGVPGTLLASLGSTSVLASDPQTTYSFTPGAPVNIAASTQYWLVLSCACPNATVNNWMATTAIGVAGLAGANVIPSAFFSSDGGTVWGSVSDRTFVFQVNGDETNGANVPEPSTFALTLSAAALLYLNRRR